MEWKNVWINDERYEDNDMEEMEAKMFKDFVQNATFTEISNAICFLVDDTKLVTNAIKEKEMNRP